MSFILPFLLCYSNNKALILNSRVSANQDKVDGLLGNGCKGDCFSIVESLFSINKFYYWQYILSEVGKYVLDILSYN